jgi:hypothetical protein
MWYVAGEYNPPLWRDEGFESQRDMDDWFRAVVPQGKTAHKYLMHFTLRTEDTK